MTAFLIPDPTMVVDVSHWDPIIKPNELLDGGVTDVILKIGGGLTEDDLFCKNGELVAKFSPLLRLHGYWWDDPIYSSDNQVAHCKKIIQDSGLPVLSVWADMEQWWGDWDKHYQAARGLIGWGQVPVFDPTALDSHCHNFMNVLKAVFPNCGVYTGRGYITSYVPAMKNWLGNFWLWYAHWVHEPDKATKMNWQELRDTWLPDYDLNLNDTGIKLENVIGHQFTGDKCLLPGSYQNIFGTPRTAMDVSVFRSDFMENLAPLPTASPHLQKPQIGGKEYIFLGAHLWVRSTPDESGKLIDSLTKSQRVNVLEINGKFAHIEKPAGWVDLSYLTLLG